MHLQRGLIRLVLLACLSCGLFMVYFRTRLENLRLGFEGFGATPSVNETLWNVWHCESGVQSQFFSDLGAFREPL
jgi:hypothetical protein